MITRQSAQKIGIAQSLKAVTVGIIIAYLIMALFAAGEGIMTALLWFTEIDYKLNLLIAIVVIYLCGYIYGGWAGYVILIKGWNKMLTGIACGFLTLLTSTFFSSLVGFFREGVKNLGSNDNPFNDYIYKPVVLVAIFGFIPVVFVGLWFGISIRKKAQKLTQTEGVTS